MDDSIFTSPTKKGTVILRGHPSHAKVLPFAGQRQHFPYFLSYFKTLSIGLAPEIKLATSWSGVKRSID